jgi:hypothetical protein
VDQRSSIWNRAIVWLCTRFCPAANARPVAKAKPLITHTFPLEQWEAAFAMITTRKSEAIKVQFAP